MDFGSNPIKVQKLTWHQLDKSKLVLDFELSYAGTFEAKMEIFGLDLGIQ